MSTTLAQTDRLYTLKESEILRGLIIELEVLRDRHQDYGGLRSSYNKALDQVRVLESHVLSREHQSVCPGCDSIRHLAT
jgi:hypothetical protein